ncbi:MAG: hypothetical protein RIM72_13910 [Alphaproteobacteria bacterium]
MTLWDKIQGFEFHHFEPLENNPLLEPFASLVLVWRSKFDGKRVPKWSDFDFTDFRGWHSRIAIHDVSYDPFSYRIRLSGEEYNQVIGMNAKGLTMEQFKSIALEDELADEFYEKTCSEMLLAYTKGINIIDRVHVDVEFLELPLSDNGIHATHTIEAVVALRSNDYAMADQ